MITLIKSNHVHHKHNGPTCTISEYAFNQPTLGTAQALINGDIHTTMTKEL